MHELIYSQQSYEKVPPLFPFTKDEIETQRFKDLSSHLSCSRAPRAYSLVEEMRRPMIPKQGDKTKVEERELRQRAWDAIRVDFLEKVTRAASWRLSRH